MKGGQFESLHYLWQGAAETHSRASRYCTRRKNILGAKAAPGIRPMTCLVQSNNIWPRASPGWGILTPDASAGRKTVGGRATLWRQAPGGELWVTRH